METKTIETTTGVNIDPSSLTTSAIEGESAHLKELLLSKLAGIEKGIDVAHKDLVRVPTDVQETVGILKELLETKTRYEAKLIKQRVNLEVGHIKELLVINDKIRIEQKQDTQLKVDDALKAQKELVTQQNNSQVLATGKSENSMIKQMEQIVTLIATSNKSLDEKITLVREQVVTTQGIALGSASSRAEQRAVGTDNRSGNALLVSIIIGVAIIISGVIFGLLNYSK